MTFRAALLCLVATPAWAQPSVPLDTLAATVATKIRATGLAGVDVSSAMVTGGTVAQSEAQRAHGQPTVRDFGATCNGVTDDSPALATAATMLRGTGTRLTVPGDCRLLLAGGAQVWLKGMVLAGPGVRDNGPVYGQQGGTIFLTDTAAAPFVVSDSWAMEGLTFFWPGQTPRPVPVAYPPLIAPHGTDTVQGFQFENNVVTNAYDLMDLTAAGYGSGHFHVSRNTILALRRAFTFATLGGESFITDNQFTVQPYLQVIGAAAGAPMMDWYANNGEVMRVVGDGTPTTRSSQSVDGLRMTGNYALIARYGIRVVGGTMNLTQLTGNTFDVVAQPVSVEAGGAVTEFHVTGGTWIAQHYGHVDQAACGLTVSGGSPGSVISLTGVAMAAVAGGGVCFQDTGAARLSISGGEMLNIGNVAVLGPYSYPAVSFNSPAGMLTMSGLPITTTSVANQTAAVQVTAAKSFSLGTLAIDNWTAAVNVASGPGATTGLVVTGTRGAKALTGTGLAGMATAGNNFDKP